MRRFEWIPGFANKGLSLPRRQTERAAGYDLPLGEDVTIPAGEIVLAPTGVRAVCPPGEFLALFPRSSLALKSRLILANGVGVIDADYYDNPDNAGHILIPLWNLGSRDISLARGERVAQAIFLTCGTADGESRPEAARTGGFGSSGDS
jgi:dUTP pyrophosphatase